jgi:hypothetical protein
VICPGLVNHLYSETQIRNVETRQASGPEVEIGKLPAGVYIVEVRARGRTQVIKLLKQ